MLQDCCRRCLYFIWIDTCCIDKSSSAELSEAINSMWTWCQNGMVCYANLPDVPSIAHNVHETFLKSRWFTRSLTSRELIAPLSMVFNSSDWQELATKFSLFDTIVQITRIDPASFFTRPLSYPESCKRCSKDVLGVEKGDSKDRRLSILLDVHLRYEYAYALW